MDFLELNIYNRDQLRHIQTLSQQAPQNPHFNQVAVVEKLLFMKTKIDLKQSKPTFYLSDLAWGKHFQTQRENLEDLYAFQNKKVNRACIFFFQRFFFSFSEVMQKMNDHL